MPTECTRLDLTAYRSGAKERMRIADLVQRLPKGRSSALDVGARDGYISEILSRYFARVTALDLERPEIDIPGVTPVAGDVTRLQFGDNSFDVAVCAEVLEHIPTGKLQDACRELARVVRHEVVIGVPYKQDTRVGRTTCVSCGRHNPPWGHLNTFDEDRLKRLFHPLAAVSIGYVGSHRERTNAVSKALMDLAGNPWGTYDQLEPCIYCGAVLRAPARRTLLQGITAKAAALLAAAQRPQPSPIWIHVVFRKER